MNRADLEALLEKIGHHGELEFDWPLDEATEETLYAWLVDIAETKWRAQDEANRPVTFAMEVYFQFEDQGFCFNAAPPGTLKA